MHEHCTFTRLFNSKCYFAYLPLWPCAFPVLPSQVWRRFSESAFSGCDFGKHTCGRWHNRCVWRKEIQSSAIGTYGGHQLYRYSCCVIVVLRTMPWLNWFLHVCHSIKFQGVVILKSQSFHVGMRLFCIFFIDYAVAIFHDALTKGHHDCYLRPDTRLPMMYIDDCIRSVTTFMTVPEQNLRLRYE